LLNKKDNNNLILSKENNRLSNINESLNIEQIINIKLWIFIDNTKLLTLFCIINNSNNDEN